MSTPIGSSLKFYQATALLVSAMIGAGLFGIPFAFAKAGFFIGTMWLVALTLLVGLFHVLLAELVLSTSGVHQIPGYVSVWLGEIPRRLSVVVHVLSLFGALLAYCILAGEFLQTIFSYYIRLDAAWYGVVFALVLSTVWLLRLRSIARVELVVIAAYTLAIFAMVAYGVHSIDSANYSGTTAHFWYLPYGVLLFSLSGFSAIPLQRQVLAGSERLLKRSIRMAMIFVACIYFLFAVLVVGVSGEVTSPAAIAGLFHFLGSRVLVIGSLLGLLTVGTSYIALGTILFETFHIEYSQKKGAAWALAIVPPIALYLSGFRNFIDIIGLVGSVAVGIQTALLLFAYLRARKAPQRSPEFASTLPSGVVMLIALVFMAGVLMEVLIR
ncbi:MAG: hypothetical protein KBC02_00410 [Candidatus Pacebacteria bacterium]|nr:hypothetical protein [Candidatus Paceibacterota bacterium]